MKGAGKTGLMQPRHSLHVLWLAAAAEGVLGGNACKPRCPTSCACNKELCPRGSEVSEEVSGYRKSCKALIIFQPRQSCP